MEGLTEGKIVHYVAYNQKHLTSIVIGVDSGTDSEKPVKADLAIFTSMKHFGEWRPEQARSVFGNEADDHDEYLMILALAIKDGNLQFQPRIPFNQEKTPGTWHWIEGYKCGR